MSESEEPGGPILEVFSHERAPIGPLTTNNCTPKCGPRLWGVSAVEGLPQTRPAPSAAACSPAGQGQRQLLQQRCQSPSLPRDGGPPPGARGDSGRGPGLAGNRMRAPQQSLQWPEPDPESPRGLWTRMTPTTTPTWQPLACMSARALIKCRVLGPSVWTPLRVLGSRSRNVHF